jgi:hypothetical protein
MRASDVRNGLRVRVTANTAGGGRQGVEGVLAPGDTIVLDRLEHGNRAIYKLNLSHLGYGANEANYMNIADLELIEPRVKKPPKIDVWEASRGYIR